MADVHASAVVDPAAELAGDVEVGPGCVVGAGVSVGPGTRLLANTFVQGRCVIGAACIIGPSAAVGTPPHHRAYAGAETWCVIGDRCVIREFATIHRAFTPGREHATTLGDDVYVMAVAHVAHDCRVGDRATLGNNVLLAGHVTVGADAFLGGAAGVHQHCRVGRLAMVGGMEVARKDVPPFATVQGGRLRAYNLVGLRRANVPEETRAAIRRAFKRLHADHRAAGELAGSDVPEVRELAAFYQSSARGVMPGQG